MAEAMVSLVVERLAWLIEEQIREGIKLVVGVEKEVENLAKKFSMIRTILEDAEKRRMKEIEVQRWMEEVQGLLYDVDDVLDEWNTAVLKEQVVSSSVKKRKLSSSSMSSSLNNVSLRGDITLKIKELNTRMEVVYKEKEEFEFTEGERNNSDVFKPIKTTSVVKESKVFGRNDDKGVPELFPHLYLSLRDVPPAMRGCFTYCAIFQKDAKIVVADLVRLWMAQGFLGMSRSEEEVELRGREYFNDLATRSFFQDFEHDEFGEEIISCKIHDIVHDFAQFMARKECLILQDESNSSDSVQVRHLYWNSTEELASVPSVCTTGKLRSFLGDSVAGDLFEDLLRNLKYVRALRLKNAEVNEIPKEISSLIHLRYLNLSENPLQKLPEELCDLINLETLDISGTDIYELPRAIGKLTNLRHLMISESSVHDFPQSLENLTSLRTLEKFVLAKGNKLGCLKNLNHLRGSLEVFVDENEDLVSEKIEMEKADLKSKKHIKKFQLMFYDQFEAEYYGDPAVSTDLIDVLGSPPNIEVLYLYSLPTTRFPTWITSLYNLRKVTIECGELWSSLPPLGRLPNLEKLLIFDISKLSCVGRDFLGVERAVTMHSTTGTSLGEASSTSSSVVVAFPKLEELLIKDCDVWEEWEDLTEKDEKSVVVFPRLQDLRIQGCSRLRTLPPRLLGMAISLEVLWIQNCDTFLDQIVKERGLSSHLVEDSIGERRVGISAYFESNEAIGEFLRQLK